MAYVLVLLLVGLLVLCYIPSTGLVKMSRRLKQEVNN